MSATSIILLVIVLVAILVGLRPGFTNVRRASFRWCGQALEDEKLSLMAG